MTENDGSSASSTTAFNPQAGRLSRRKVFQAPEMLQGALDDLLASLERAAGGQVVSEGQAIRAAVAFVLDRRTDPEVLERLLVSIREEVGVTRAVHAASMIVARTRTGLRKPKGKRIR